MGTVVNGVCVMVVLGGWIATPTAALNADRSAGLSVSVRKGTTFSVQWGPPQWLRRDPFDPSQGSNRLDDLSCATFVAAVP